MRRLIYCLSFITIILHQAIGQEVKIEPKKLDDNSIEIYIYNGTEQGQSVRLNCELKGMTSNEKLPITKFIPTGEKRLFTTLKPKDIYKGFGYGTSIEYVEGDVTATHDDSHVYQLPYPKGKSYRIDQGYLGKQTHMGIYALDFNMEVGSEVTAIRDGVVTKVVDKFDKGCPDESCEQFNNLVIITHEDGSLATYSHLKKRGAKVQLGDTVKAGDLIGLSGKTGWASGPHLHLEVYLASWDGKKSVRAKYFLTEDETGEPKEGSIYTQTK